jgi:hypothetical protein
MRFQEIQNTDSGIIFISKEINHGDWPFRFIIKLEYTGYASKEWEKESGPYFVSILAVSPTAAGDKVCASVAETLSMTTDEFKALADVDKYMMVAEYGAAATLFQVAGHNMRKLLAQARKEMFAIDFMFGFYMDKVVNAVGATGWDWICGDFDTRGRAAREAAAEAKE